MTEFSRTELGQRVDSAIAEAKHAACMAGVSEDETEDYYDRLVAREGLSRTTFAVHLDGLSSAIHAGQLERTLRDIPGVEATVIYNTSMAWISAPDTLSPEEIHTRIQKFGVDSWLSTSSLRRRAERLNPVERKQKMLRYQRLLSRNERKEAENKTIFSKLEAARNLRHGWGKHRNNTEVLFTARALITRSRLIVAVLLGTPVILLHLIQPLQFSYWQWLCLLLATPVVTWCSWPFHRAALAGISRGMSAMDGATSLAVLAAYFYSLVELLITPIGDVGWETSPMLLARHYNSPANTGSLFFDVACGVTILALFGRMLSRRTGLRSQAQFLPPDIPHTVQVTAVRKDKKGKPEKTLITTAEIRVGEDIIIPKGGMIPADGEIMGGKSLIELGPTSGSDRQEVMGVGGRVYAGGRNLGSDLKVRVHRTGSQTRLASMRRRILSVQKDSHRINQWATRTASWLIPWAVGIAIINYSLWILLDGSAEAAFATSLSILAGVAPVALALSTPLPTWLGMAKAVAGGALLSSSRTMTNLAEIDSLIFNRVGSLNEGTMTVLTVQAAKDENPDLILRVAGALSMESEHPVSRAIVHADREARDNGAGGDSVPHWLETGQVHITGAGTFSGMVTLPSGTVEATLWRPRDLSEITDHKLATVAVSGGTPLLVSWKGKIRGVITVADTFKEDAPEAIDQLEDMGIETYMLSRDMYPVARKVADQLGITTVLAGIAPGRKEATVRSVHAQGAQVAMVGDRDILPSLRVADVGILVGAGDRFDDVEADVVLIREDVKAIPELINLVRSVRSIAAFNLWFTWIYNFLIILLSMMGLIHPLLATVCMLGSSAFIEWWSARILRFDYSLGKRRGNTWWTKRILTLFSQDNS